MAKNEVMRKLKITSLLITGPLLGYFLCLAPASAAGTPINQTNAQAVAEDLNRKASDASMQSSTTSAMKALMHFANSEMPSAVNNGMTAYGKYRNSENLDKLGDLNTMNAASMGSANEAGITKVVKTNTSFRRLDPKFLYTGEAAKVAAEFEKKTGMKREQFLKELSDVSEKKISRNDPQLMDKVLSRFESFASRIPNAEFRKKLENGIQRVPNTVRKGLVAKAISKFASFMAGPNEAPAPAITGKTEPTPATEGQKNEPNLAAIEQRPKPTLSTVAETPSAAPSQEPQAPHPSNLLGSVIGDAIRTQAEERSIFDQVTRKIRSLTPGLGKNNQK